MIGPNVIQAIISRTREHPHFPDECACAYIFAPESNWEGFPFLFALCVAASLIIWFGVDVQTGRRDAVRFANEKRAGGALADKGEKSAVSTSI